MSIYKHSIRVPLIVPPRRLEDRLALAILIAVSILVAVVLWGGA